MSYVPWYACSLNFIRIIPDRLSYNGEGVFYTQRTRQKNTKEKGRKQSGKERKRRTERRKREAGKREREKKKGKKDKTGKTERAKKEERKAKKEERKTTKSEMEKSRKLFAATRLTLGFLGTNFFTFIIMKNYIVGKGVLFL